MKVGVIGFGSIGRRHVKNLLSLGQTDIVLLREINTGNPHNLQEVSTIKELISEKPKAVILANPTSMHSAYLHLILKNGIDILAEKPLVSSTLEIEGLERALAKYPGVGMTAYNMRFHPCIKKAKEILSSGVLGDIFSARLYVGQYLPDWRPGKMYSETYSAMKEMGGGVVFDLIHEIDIACDLFGIPNGSITSIVDKLSELEIDVEDLAEILYQTRSGSIVSIHLDYLTRGYKRDIHIRAQSGTMEIDLASHHMKLNVEGRDSCIYRYANFEKNEMYVDLLSSFLEGSANGEEKSPTLADGLISNRIAVNIRSNYYQN